MTSGEAPADVRVEVGTPPATGPLLEVRDLRVDFSHGGRRIRAVNGLSYALPVGRTLALIGESGSGKTVSSRAIMGLLPATATVSGSVRFEGQELIGLSDKAMRRHRGADIAMVFQDPSRSLNPTMRIGAQIAEAVRAHARVDRGAARDRALELLKLVRLPSPEQRLHEYAHQLSGGMRQRVVIAIALASEPKLLIADEATTALDVTTQAQIMELLRDLQRQLGMALVMISHDLGLAASFADEVVVMYAGRAVEQAPTRELFAHVRMPYTKALLDAIPRVERPPHTPLPVVAGRPPDLAALPAGCPFSPRCPKAQDMCRETAPPLEEGSPGHRWACWFPCEDAIPARSRRARSRQEGTPRGPERQRRRAAALRAQRRAGVRGARPRRREGRRRAGRLRRLLRRARRRDARRGRRDRLGQVDARALRAAGAAAEVGLRALPGQRPRRPEGPPAARGAPLAADGLPGPVRLAGPEVAGRRTSSRSRSSPTASARREERRRRVREVLDTVGLDPDVYGKRRPRQLSGGQAQRVAIARALTLDPALIICDEAVSSLDVLIQAQVLNLFEGLRAELGLSYLFIAHDLALVKQVSDRVAVMYLGRLCELGPAEALYREPFHPYTVALLASIPSPDPDAARAAGARGDQRRSALARRPAQRMSLPHALPARAGALRGRGARDARARAPTTPSPATSRSSATAPAAS